MKFENVLEEINSFGPFQIHFIVVLCLSRIVLPCHFLLNNFVTIVPPHHCDISALVDGHAFGNLTQEQSLAVSLPMREDGSPESCAMFAEPQLQLLSNDSDGAELPTVQCQNGWAYNNTIVTSSVAIEWDLVCDRKSLSKTLGTVFFIGLMLGAVFFGYLCDKFGRKKSIFVSYAMAMVFGFASVFANSYSMFAALRFLSGFGISGIGIIPMVLSMEWVSTSHRSSMSVIGSLAWSIGNMLLAGLAYVVRDWRMLMVTITAPLALAMLTWWWIPESARWLLAKGKVEQAQFYLDKCAQVNKRPKLSSTVKLEALAAIEMSENQSKNFSYLHLIKTPKMRRLSLLSGIIWFGVACTYYCISLNITGFGLNMYLTHFIYAAIEVPAKILINFFLNLIGRRKCQSGTLLLTGVCIIINIFLPQGLWIFRTLVAILGKGFAEAAFTTAYIHTSEIFPTVIRQSAMGYTNFMARVGVSVAPLILMLDDVWPLLAQIIICSVAVLCGLLAVLLPETLNVGLPETIDDIERPRRNYNSHSTELTSVALTSKHAADSQE